MIHLHLIFESIIKCIFEFQQELLIFPTFPDLCPYYTDMRLVSALPSLLAYSKVVELFF